MENLMLVSAANCPSQIESSRWFTIVKWSFLFWKNRKKSPTSQTPYLLVGATEWQQNTWLFPQNSFKANSWRQHPTSTWEHPTVPSPGKIRGREFPKTQRWNTTCQVIELLLSNVRSWGNVDNVEDHMVYPINIYIYIYTPYIHCLLTKNTSILDLYPFPNIYCIFISLKSGVSSGNKTHQWHSIILIGS